MGDAGECGAVEASSSLSRSARRETGAAAAAADGGPIADLSMDGICARAAPTDTALCMLALRAESSPAAHPPLLPVDVDSTEGWKRGSGEGGRLTLELAWRCSDAAPLHDSAAGDAEPGLLEAAAAAPAKSHVAPAEGAPPVLLLKLERPRGVAASAPLPARVAN